MGPVAAGIVAFLVYARTALPGVAYGDWGEMQTVAHVLGVPHPTGYPTYVLLAWAAEHLPIGSVAWRANLLSGVFVAIAVGALVAILQRLEVRTVIAVGIALAVGFVGTVWAAATVAEVNPLHLCLMALLVLVTLRWADARRPRDFLLGALLVSLALGNHALTLFVAPWLIAYALWAGRRELLARPVLLLAAAAVGVAGLGVYLYLPVAASRNPPLAYNHPTTLDSVLWLVTGQQFRYQFDLFSPKGPGEALASLPTLWATAADRATPVLPLLGLVGLPLVVRRRPAFGLAVIGILVTGIFVWATYERLEHYLLVPFLMVGIGAGVALDAAANGIARAWRRVGRRPDAGAGAAVVMGAVALGLAVVLVALNFGDADHSGDHQGDDYMATMFRALPANAAVISYWDPTMPLWYGQYVEGLRPDVRVIDDSTIVYDHLGSTMDVIGSLVCKRPVFVIRINDQDLAPIRERYRLTPFLTVRSSALGPTAVLDQAVFRVEPPASCPGG